MPLIAEIIECVLLLCVFLHALVVAALIRTQLLPFSEPHCPTLSRLSTTLAGAFMIYKLERLIDPYFLASPQALKVTVKRYCHALAVPFCSLAMRTPLPLVLKGCPVRDILDMLGRIAIIGFGGKLVAMLIVMGMDGYKLNFVVTTPLR